MNISDQELGNIIRNGIQKIPSENFTEKVMYSIEPSPKKIQFSPEYTFGKLLLPLFLFIIIPLAGIYWLATNPDYIPSFNYAVSIFPELKNLMETVNQLAPLLIFSALSLIIWNLIGEILILKYFRGKINIH